jgi:hypothetical protein
MNAVVCRRLSDDHTLGVRAFRVELLLASEHGPDPVSFFAHGWKAVASTLRHDVI